MSDNDDLVLLAAAFPAHAIAIEALRRRDPEFAEICADYAALARLAGAHKTLRAGDDVLESLTGLRQDIHRALATHLYARPTLTKGHD